MGNTLSEQLFDACKKGNIKGVKRLLNEKEVDPNLVDNEGKTPLHYVCNNGNLDIVKLLLKANADPNLPNKYGDTPLHCSCAKGDIKIAELLIANGANQNLKACDGKTAWDLAVVNGHEHKFRHLERK
jgi:ankyrin repeat protein